MNIQSNLSQSALKGVAAQKMLHVHSVNGILGLPSVPSIKQPSPELHSRPALTAPQIYTLPTGAQY